MTRRQGYVAIVQHLQDIHAHHQHELNASGRHMVRRPQRTVHRRCVQ